MKYSILSAFALVLAGCSTGVVPAGPDTYMVSCSVAGITTGSRAKAKAYRIANDWCTKRGLVMLPVSTDQGDTVVGGKYAHAELYFRALKPGDSEIHRPSVDKPDHIQRVQNR